MQARCLLRSFLRRANCCIAGAIVGVSVLEKAPFIVTVFAGARIRQENYFCSRTWINLPASTSVSQVLESLALSIACYVLLLPLFNFPRVASTCAQFQQVPALLYQKSFAIRTFQPSRHVCRDAVFTDNSPSRPWWFCRMCIAPRDHPCSTRK